MITGRRRPALPVLAELSEVGQHDIAQDGRHGQIGEISLHPADPPLVRLGVQPEAAWRAHRLQQAVAILPGPEHMVADAEAPAQLTDAQQRGIPGKLHDNTIQSLDSKFDNPSKTGLAYP